MIVDTEKVLREADGPDEGSMKKLDSGGKVVAKGSSRDRASVPEDHERQYPLKPRSKWKMHRRY